MSPLSMGCNGGLVLKFSSDSSFGRSGELHVFFFGAGPGVIRSNAGSGAIIFNFDSKMELNRRPAPELQSASALSEIFSS